MVDRLKLSLEQVVSPMCAHCHIEMKWYRSSLEASEPTIIAHFFACPNCNRTSDTKSVVTDPAVVPPRKLSAPQIRQVLAA